MEQVMTRRPPKFIPDYLTPMPSHLLATLLTDLTTGTAPRPRPSSPAVQTPPPPLPQGHHLVYFPIQTPPSGLAADGADGDHEPPPQGGLRRRRLWAGGELVFRDGWRQGLRLDGRPWACSEALERVRRVPAGQGDKVFVDVWRRYGLGHEREREGWDVEERRTLVFMPIPDLKPAASCSSSSPSKTCESQPPPTRRFVKYPHPPSLSVPIRPPTPAHLFHFSALTLNAHAIHLDPRYAAATDGHRALLVHGPLALALMLRVLAAACSDSSDHGRAEGIVRRLTYRNYAPLYVGEPMTVCARRLAAPCMWDVWVEGPGGALAVKGTAEVEAE
ncbi:itaconyl-CoA hydratase [Hirsutella rhossiliensis]|uniref:Itaconyl-CoA hydratase n=1 Tax=Hirsutella rhossiliensis TaxID=111463 RepID=A0A9P8MYF6_9HYPO|nr:itaconyl-CoA hydratase [Hirsutella rhossiliensis]KAH0963519.1 itaconyl-CoA hydratase [Hirsutella rhossiliensis]